MTILLRGDPHIKLGREATNRTRQNLPPVTFTPRLSIRYDAHEGLCESDRSVMRNPIYRERYTCAHISPLLLKIVELQFIRLLFVEYLG